MCFQKSIPEYVLVKRLNDNASAWAGGDNTRFASKNECDFILFDTKRKIFLGCELKTTSHKSLTYWREDFNNKNQNFMIKKSQIQGLKKWSLFKNTVCGFVINVSSFNNDTFFVHIKDFLKYTSQLSKKSINYNDVQKMNGIKINNQLKKTNYKYDIENFLVDSKRFVSD